MKVINLVAIPYNALPCEAEVFIVNGIKASKSDFGDNGNVGSFNYEYGDEAAENWACADNQFVPHKEIPDGVLSEYEISDEQYREIQSMLVEKFNVGRCGWCV